jgi:L-amino acid N-acyltransferase YncA
MRLVVVKATEPQGWALMYGMCQRVWSFCEKYDRHTNPTTLVRNLMQAFTADNCLLFPIAILNISDQVVGHALVSIEPWTGKTFLVVLQLAIDDDHHIGPDLYRQGMTLLRELATAYKAEYIQTLAFTEKYGDMRRARLFRRLGFESIGVTMRIPLTVPGDAEKPREPEENPKLDPDVDTVSTAGETVQ